MGRLRESKQLRNDLNSAIEKAKFAFTPPLVRRARSKASPPSRFIAYDLETSTIAEGTPQVRYITAFGAEFHFAAPVAGLGHLQMILVTHFLIEAFLGVRFVAWSGNRFDAYFIAAALITNPRFVIFPYLTKSKALRGMRIVLAEHADDPKAPCWEFLDGIAMTGLVGVKLEKFVATFAPAFPKLVGVIDFESGEQFDANNALHCEYAMRDSEGLYHGIVYAEAILLEHFNQSLAVTMGGACIRIFQAHLPDDVSIDPLIPDLKEIVLSHVMRGGFCFIVRKYSGPVWKYDLNQAYADAMRKASLPAGGALYYAGSPPIRTKPFIARITATNPRNKVPFYYRTEDKRERVLSQFAETTIADTWITSIEYDQLQSEGWHITCTECYVWSDSFSMTDYVNRLETLRTTCDGGPSGPIGTMVKAVGNHSYGKTVEQLEPIKYLLAASCPGDCVPLVDDVTEEAIEHVYCRVDDDRRAKAYHQPHIGAWITAYVRMQIRRAALVAPDAWLYADTDCVIFSRDVASHLDIDAKRYGAFKIEEEGTEYKLIAKKVYTQTTYDVPKPKRSAKGMNVKRLKDAHFEWWFNGDPPVQEQTQIQNFLSFIRDGNLMFKSQARKGTRI